MTLNWPVVNISVSLDNASFFFKESGYLLAKTQNSTLCRLYSSCVGLNMVWFLNLCGTLNLKAMFTKRWVFILPMVIRKEEVLAGSLQTPWEAWLCDHCCKIIVVKACVCAQPLTLLPASTHGPYSTCALPVLAIYCPLWVLTNGAGLYVVWISKCMI